jgi:hypothetical protein
LEIKYFVGTKINRQTVHRQYSLLALARKKLDWDSQSGHVMEL